MVLKMMYWKVVDRDPALISQEVSCRRVKVAMAWRHVRVPQMNAELILELRRSETRLEGQPMMMTDGGLKQCAHQAYT
jgi:hypothetical protein